MGNEAKTENLVREMLREKEYYNNADWPPYNTYKKGVLANQGSKPTSAISINLNSL